MKKNLSPIQDKKLAGLLDHLAGEESFVFLETTRVDEENYLSYVFTEPIDQLTCHAVDDSAQFLEMVQRYLDEGYYVAGSFSYEFGYLLEDSLAGLLENRDQVVASLGVYRKPFIYDHRLNDFVGEMPWPKWGLSNNISTDFYQVKEISFSQSKEDYLESVARIKCYIESGDTYQVNYTLKLLFDFQGSAVAFYKTLRRNQSVSYSAFMKEGERCTLSFSPELFFKKKGQECVVRPMKGTMRRAPGFDDDRLVRNRLAADSKNRSENIMIVDLLRNDLGKLCQMGQVETVSLFDVETYETLHQMTSSLRGKLKPDVELLELFRAIFPCGSVTGAPKIRTMEIIQELESVERGVYTGGIGFISPDGEAVFNVPIRTVTLDGGCGEMGIGSGIVYDSDPQQEWDECRLKGQFLQSALPEFELIETILFCPQRGYWLLDRHLGRLKNSALYWGFSFPEADIVQALADVGNTFDNNEYQRVRLLLHKDGALEIKADACDAPEELIEPEGRELPVVVLSSSHTDSSDPFYYHKTTFRGIYDAEREKSSVAGFLEVLFCNERGELTEGSISNIFLVKGEKLLTPPLGCGLLGGILREALLAGEIPTPDNYKVVEDVLTVKDLQKSEAVYIGNSVRGLIRVKFLDGWSG